ncbi:MAG: metallophosphoesterase [Desulfurococcales archaeon]|nr:metallophosphoesterase [Desulfurococcales archaeon]
MLVGVISDSHDNLANVSRAARILREKGVGAVFHLGDIVSPFTLAHLAGLLEGVEIHAVFGNNCGEIEGLLRVASTVGADISSPPREVALAGRKILLLHGFGSPDMTRKIVYSLARGGEWDLILYGHTHIPDAKIIGGTLVYNPGELAGALNKPTLGLIDLDDMRWETVTLE